MKTKPEATKPSEPAGTTLSYHERICTVCRHPARYDIEEQFVHWHSPANIADDFNLETRALYRHAHAFNLFDIRDRNLRFSLGHIVQRAQNVRASADSVIRAVHAYTRVNKVGEWVEPPAHVIVSSGAQLTPADTPPPRHLPPHPSDAQSPGSRNLDSALPQPLIEPSAQRSSNELLPQLDTTGRTESESTH